MYMILHLVAKWIHCRNYQYLYKVWIEWIYSWSWELIVMLNRWELLLGHVGIWDVWEKCQFVNYCQGAITAPWSLLNSPLTPIVAVCSLTQKLLLSLISLKRNANSEECKFYFGRYYNNRCMHNCRNGKKNCTLASLPRLSCLTSSSSSLSSDMLAVIFSLNLSRSRFFLAASACRYTSLLMSVDFANFVTVPSLLCSCFRLSSFLFLLLNRPK